MMLRPLLRTTVLSTAMFLDPDALAEAQEGASGTVAGRITDGATHEPLPGAVIKVDGTASGTASQRDGTYRIPRVPAGKHTITVSYLGYGDATVDVEVAAGASVEKNVELRIAFSDVVEVSDSALDAQARALNQQRSAANITNVVSADQIGRFPDPNAAEATSRIPGVSIARDQGEGRYVLIRGTEARLNAMTINGERIPSPEGDLRQVSLDIIPTDLLDGIEVSKALTPDMDADAIGGAVNLVTKSAPEEPRIQFNLASGFNKTRSSYDQLSTSLTFSRRFADGKLGFLFSGSSNNSTRGSENFEAEYNDGDLETLENRRYEFSRKRQGANVALDYRPSPNSMYSLNGMFNYYKDDEVRRRLTNAIDDNELAREVRARVEKQKIANIALSGRHFFTRTEADFKLSFSRSTERDPDSRFSVFLQEDVEFDPNVSPDSIDPDNIQANAQNEDFGEYALDELRQEVNFSKDRDIVGSFNLRRFLGGGTDFSGWLKGGVKYRSKEKSRESDENEFDFDDDVAFGDVEQSNVASIIGGRYHPGPFQLPGFAAQASRGLEPEPNRELDAEDFDASEKTAAAYGMASLQFGPKLNVLGGLRYERTDLDYTGYEVDFDADGEYIGTRPQTGSSDYGLLLPMVHLRYALDSRSNIRAAVTRTLARPNYYDLVPYEVINREDEEILRGNPTLRPTTSWNVDLMAERYFTSVGVISAGLFYKRLNNYIFNFNTEEEFEGDDFDILQPTNGDGASVKGIELAFQNQLKFLPAPFDGLGFYANYTFTDSSARFPGRNEDSTLPGQSRHVGNVALSYEKSGFQGRVAANFHGKFIDEVAGTALEDRYYDNHTQFDISLSQAIGRKARVFAELLNLSDAPLRYYRGVPTRPDQEEYYRWWAVFGVKLNVR